MMNIFRYTENRKHDWDSFVAASRQGTFLLNRNYMDYHKDRFQDHSLIISDNRNIIALFPANTHEDTVFSHQGLTYGGLITNTDATSVKVCDIFDLINTYYKKAGFRKIVYKAIPWIYHRIPAEEDLYALFKVCKANIIARDISSSIIIDHRIKWTNERNRGVKRAIKNGIEVKESNAWHDFWQLLTTNLQTKYNVCPVHSLEEITLLKSKFPNNIKLYGAFKAGFMLGGTVIYHANQVAHVQYISANTEGKQYGAIDKIFDFLLNKELITYQYLDFGKSTENQGHFLNASLIHQKEGFGGRGVVYDTYEWTL